MKKKIAGSNLTKGLETLEWEILWGKGPLYNTWLLLKDIKDLGILLVISDQEDQRQDKSSVAARFCLMLHRMLTRPPKHTHLGAHEHVAELNRMQGQCERVNINLLWDFVNKHYCPLNFVMNFATLGRHLQESFNSGRGAWEAQRTLPEISLSWTKISVSLTSEDIEGNLKLRWSIKQMLEHRFNCFFKLSAVL